MRSNSEAPMDDKIASENVQGTTHHPVNMALDEERLESNVGSCHLVEPQNSQGDENAVENKGILLVVFPAHLLTN